MIKIFIMESKSEITPNISETGNLANFIPQSQLKGPCAECELTNNLSYCFRCKVSLCNYHVLSHLDYSTCVSCDNDVCLAMMGMLLDKPTDKCFHCETSFLLTKLKTISDELYDLSIEKGSLNTEIKRHNQDVNILHNAKHYGSPFASRF